MLLYDVGIYNYYFIKAEPIIFVSASFTKDEAADNTWLILYHRSYAINPTLINVKRTAKPVKYARNKDL